MNADFKDKKLKNTWDTDKHDAAEPQLPKITPSLPSPLEGEGGGENQKIFFSFLFYSVAIFLSVFICVHLYCLRSISQIFIKQKASPPP
jgi:hypothetical protein